jgi:hypothetical protein
MANELFLLQCGFLTHKKGENMDLYTKNGRPLQVSGDTVYSRSGKVVGRIRGEKVYGTDGRYVGTITNDRLVYRSTDNAGISSHFSATNRVGSARVNRVGSAIWGDEPDIPD